VLLFLPTVYREAVARSVRATVLRPVLAIQQGAVERGARFDDPDRLRAERDSLAAFMIGQSTLSAENRQLRELLGLNRRLPPSFVPAEVVRVPGRGADGFFQLTAGAQRGVGAGAPIVAASGLVGRVRSVDDRISFAIDWMHQEFRASAMTVDGTVYGILEPRRGPGGEPMLALTGTPRHVELEEGAVIVTSGHGGVFPRGIPVGVVAGAEGAEAGWQRNYLIRPFVSPAEMTYVLVLGAPQEALDGQDLAEVWGIRAEEPPAPDVMMPAGPTPAAQAGAPPAAAPAQPRPAQPRVLGVPVQPAVPDTAAVQPDGGP
jgi:rod shape-determining protein MreC